MQNAKVIYNNMQVLLSFSIICNVFFCVFQIWFYLFNWEFSAILKIYGLFSLNQQTFLKKFEWRPWRKTIQS